MQNESFPSNTERNNSKFVHIDILFYLFIYLLSSWCHLSHNIEENKKMTPLATAFQTLLHHQLSWYCVYINIFIHTHHKQQQTWEDRLSQNDSSDTKTTRQVAASHL